MKLGRVLNALVNRQNRKISCASRRPVLYNVCILRNTAGGRLLQSLRGLRSHVRGDKAGQKEYHTTVL